MKIGFHNNDYALEKEQRSLSIWEWEEEIVKIRSVKPLVAEDIFDLAELLSCENDLDSYTTSSVYYLLTCSQGLWLYQEQSSFILFGWHPNVAGQIIIFPARGKANATITTNLLQKLPQPPQGIQLVRLKGEAGEVSSAHHKRSCSIFVKPVAEHVLDWRYPVRVLSSSKIIEMQGADYMRIRNHIRQAQKYSIQVQEFDKADVPHIRALALRLVSQRTKDILEIPGIMDFYDRILNLSLSQNTGLQGLVFTIGEKIEAAAMWDVSNTLMPMANVYANISNTHYHGLSEFVMRAIADKVASQGIKYINLGGSETKSLDDYKRKYIPAYSIVMHSAETSLYNAGAEPRAYTAGKRSIFDNVCAASRDMACTISTQA